MAVLNNAVWKLLAFYRVMCEQKDFMTFGLNELAEALVIVSLFTGGIVLILQGLTACRNGMKRKISNKKI